MRNRAENCPLRAGERTHGAAPARGRGGGSNSEGESHRRQGPRLGGVKSDTSTLEPWRRSELKTNTGVAGVLLKPVSCLILLFDLQATAKAMAGMHVESTQEHAGRNLS